MNGMLVEAMEEIVNGLKAFPGSPDLLCQMGQVYAHRNEKDKTQEILDELLERAKKEYVTPFVIASLYTELGKLDKAYKYLDEGYGNKNIKFPPFITFYRKDPRFEAFFKKIGIQI